MTLFMTLISAVRKMHALRLSSIKSMAGPPKMRERVKKAVLQMHVASTGSY